MKKIFFIAFCLIAAISYGQNPASDSQRWKSKTTAERDAYSDYLPGLRFLYNSDTGQFEYKVGAGAWQAFGTGGGITWATPVNANITYSADNTYTFGSDSAAPSQMFVHALRYGAAIQRLSLDGTSNNMNQEWGVGNRFQFRASIGGVQENNDFYYDYVGDAWGFESNLDMNTNEIQNAGESDFTIVNTTTGLFAPDLATGTTGAGSIYLDTDDNEFYGHDGTSFVQLSGGGGSGDVVGPASSTDNALVRFDGTTGKLVKNSPNLIYDGSGLFINRPTGDRVLELNSGQDNAKAYVKGDGFTGIIFERGATGDRRATYELQPYDGVREQYDLIFNNAGSTIMRWHTDYVQSYKNHNFSNGIDVNGNAIVTGEIEATNGSRSVKLLSNDVEFTNNASPSYINQSGGQNLILQTDNASASAANRLTFTAGSTTTDAIFSSTNVLISELAGNGSGLVSIDNTGQLGFTAAGTAGNTSLALAIGNNNADASHLVSRTYMALVGTATVTIPQDATYNFAVGTVLNYSIENTESAIVIAYEAPATGPAISTSPDQRSFSLVKTAANTWIKLDTGSVNTYNAPELGSLNGGGNFTVTDANIHSGTSKVHNQLSAAETIEVTLDNLNAGEIDVFNFDVTDAGGQLDFFSANDFIVDGITAGQFVRLDGIGAVDFIETGPNTNIFKVYAGTNVSFVTPSSVPVVESSTTAYVDDLISVSVAKPAGVQNDDLIYCLCASDAVGSANEWGDGSRPTTSWTFIRQAGNTNTRSIIGSFYIVADGTEGAGPYTFTALTTAADLSVICTRISGVNTTAPIGVQGTPLLQDTDVTDFVVPGLTTGNNNSLAIIELGFDGSNGAPFGVSAGWTKEVELDHPDNTGDNTEIVIASKPMPTTGATGDGTITVQTAGDGTAYMTEIRSE